MSGFSLTEDQQMMAGMAKTLADDEFKARAGETDEQVLYPEENVALINESGFTVSFVPEEYGGAGLDYSVLLTSIFESARTCGSTAAILAGGSVATDVIAKCGTEEQIGKYIPEIAEGNVLAYASGEGDADADAFDIRTTAKADGDGYIINGKKTAVINIGKSAGYIVTAVIEGEDRIAAFIVDADAVGLTIGDAPVKLGLRGCPIGDIELKDCRVSADAMLRADGKDVISLARDDSCLVMAALSLGIARGAMEEAIEYVNVRVQFGKRIAQFLNTQGVLGKLEAELRAAELLLRSAAALKDSGGDYTVEAAATKLICTDLSYRMGRQSVQCFGGYGYIREYPVERMLRDAKMTEVLGGTSRQQKYTVAHSIGVE